MALSLGHVAGAGAAQRPLDPKNKTKIDLHGRIDYESIAPLRPSGKFIKLVYVHALLGSS